MTMRQIIIILLFRAIVINSYRILHVAPGHSSSHLMFNARVAKALATDGRNNDIVFLVPEYHPYLPQKLNLPKNVREIRALVIQDPKIWQKLSTSNSDIFDDEYQVQGIRSQMANFYAEIFAAGCKNVVQNQSLMSSLTEQRFDAAILHMATFCEFGLAHLLKISTIIWMSSGLPYDSQLWSLNIPAPYSHVPQLLSPFSDKMAFQERLSNTFHYLSFHLYDQYSINIPQTLAFRKIYGSSFPDLFSDIASKVTHVFTNSHSFLDYARPVSSQISHIAGIGMKNWSNVLDDYWTNIVNNSIDGVVLFSLGSITNTEGMPEKWKNSFIEAFSKFPTFTVIWKFDGKINIRTLPSNIVITSWMPQKELLNSGRVKAFITHGGFNSIMEASLAGVPLVMIPLFWDQYRNVGHAVSRGVGIQLIRRRIRDPRYVVHTLTEVLYNISYAKSAEKSANYLAMVNDQIDRDSYIAKSVGFVIKHTNFLSRKKSKLNLLEYFLLDILSVTLIPILLLICFLRNFVVRGL